MSVKSVSSQLATTKNWGGEVPSTSEWVRHSDWVTLAPLAANEHKFVGIHAIYPDANFVALSAAGNYTVDWGDDVVENFASGVTAQHIYDYTTYDVSNATLCSRGYKQAIVQVYPQADQTFSALNLHVKHNQTGLQAYSSGFLDIALAGADLIDVRIGVQTPGSTTQVINFNWLERVSVLSSDLRNASGLFYRSRGLQSIGSLVTSNDPAVLLEAALAPSVVTVVGHGRRNGDSVLLVSVSNTTGITVGTSYYVVNATSDTFQVSTTYGGSAVTLVGEGTASFVAGTDISRIFQECGMLSTVPFFDTASVTRTDLAFSTCASLVRVPLLNMVNVYSATQMFYSCNALRQIPLFNTSSLRYASAMFSGCSSITSIPAFNLSNLRDMSSMFLGTGITETPVLSIPNVTSLWSTFSSCSRLKAVKLVDTGSLGTIQSAFQSCTSLVDAPVFNTSSVMTFSVAFDYCTSLNNVPAYDLSNAVDTSSMFFRCYSLETVPSLNTSKCTSVYRMFGDCNNLKYVPHLDLSLCRDASMLFNNCTSLAHIPALDFSSVKGRERLRDQFAGCPSISSISAVNMRVPFTVAGCKLSSTELTEIFANLYTVGTVEVTFDVATDTVTLPNHGFSTSNYDQISFSQITGTTGISTNVTYYSIPGTVTADTFKISATVSTTPVNLTGVNGSGVVTPPTITISNNFGAVTPVSLSGTTTAGSTTVTMANTTNITVGMQVTGTGTPSTTARAVTFTASGSTVNLTAHGLSNGDEVSFATIVETTGITLNAIYFVVNVTADTFQVANTAGGAARTLTNNGTGTLRYKATVTAINPNVSVTLSRPASSSGTNTLAFRTLKTNTALLKGWSITG